MNQNVAPPPGVCRTPTFAAVHLGAERVAGVVGLIPGNDGALQVVRPVQRDALRTTGERLGL